MNTPIVISGPSGCGKSTLLQMLFSKYPDRYSLSVSHTTRQPREGEQDGIAYHFTTRPLFEEMIRQGDFVEHASFSGNLYGTSVKSIENVRNSGKRCILDIEVNGVKAVHRLCDSMPSVFAGTQFVFIAPPSLDVLRERLVKRGSESDITLQARLQSATEAIEYAKHPSSYDKIIVNDNLNAAFEELCEFLGEK